MTYENLTLSLPSDLVGTLHCMALERGGAVNDLMRGMLDREVTRLRSTQAIVEARASRVSRLRQLLAPELRRATGWADLQSRLALYGVELRIGDGGLMLHDLITREPLCPSAALGFGGPELSRKFGGHATDEPCTVPAA